MFEIGKKWLPLSPKGGFLCRLIDGNRLRFLGLVLETCCLVLFVLGLWAEVLVAACVPSLAGSADASVLHLPALAFGVGGLRLYWLLRRHLTGTAAGGRGIFNWAEFVI
jgi:hypothetical protein